MRLLERAAILGEVAFGNKDGRFGGLLEITPVASLEIVLT
jgi:hypothetical protein